MRELPLNPSCDKWDAFTKPNFIEGKIFDICEDIVKRGYRTNYKKVFDLLYEHIDEYIDQYYPSEDLQSQEEENG